MAGYLYVAAAAFLWGLLGVVSKWAFAAGVSPLEVAFWRAALGGVLFGAQAFILGQVRVEPADRWAVVGFGLVGVSLFYGAYQLAIQNGGAALASVLLYTAPAIVALLSWLLLREPMGPHKLSAVGLTLLGVALVSLQGGEARITAAAVLWGLLSALTYATYYLFGKLYLGRYSTPTLFLYALPVGALGLLPFVRFAPKTAEAWAAIGFLTVASTFFAVTLYFAGLKRLEATRASVVATLEPVVAALAAWLFWGERFSPLGYLGAGLVLLGVVWMVLGPQDNPRDQPKNA
ncbi:MAG: EamA family transporter [Meiothermus sp.]|uniref:DMT family transporter n=1 Tax=Meiothermus sp. TaxID=1955249 RepID=UPI0025CF2C96|nr:EamA family transporter [Meiothermus sp.]MCS7058978.1 EamA family transporter [Meiothermus sp.]MCS7195592.1 EamA family transporter [Meiothermus sp.]MCX7741406.1 EamA family transporter [Meiothermus sp.]MDW8091466.1 EamA family transporter [Meiothermus sp.]MDW8480333.1 EamA family transporter [Meiothermus sp.]